ncbi:DUF4230 domain-containing protein [Jejuia pallidilutea]|uniref:Uncharacterized protein DUF4230 n=1 Tax=Jejuia pallidilutea TaxID=504487 RepID=A0A090VXP8_9FLAO|nr:DUF4230 domain-containing protein [Jejuia pallidilutea]PQV51276.1 uncharacterized protein DUF4230 [Jejuia pallidilutea]GAL68763.1 hypothetical protein JCM19301_1133 [Jejuia pallidilutea]GAL73204.1 hypothetical protein JCM19302_1801 [Jejuia pallidilutea]GAL90342.1 hypothetical protein JCM19538_107 [Jejuia pallidilutea]
MRKILFGVVITLVVLFTFKYCEDKKQENISLKESSALIQEQIKNVGKLVVTEGHFSEVFTYKNSKDVFGDLISAKKKALVVVNAEVTIAYDLSKITFNIDAVNKTLSITNIPEAEVKVHPDLEYYDVQADYLNPFDAKDYNNINNTVKQALLQKIDKSDLKANAKNRLISELSKFYILTNSMGWTLKYNETPLLNREAIQAITL